MALKSGKIQFYDSRTKILGHRWYSTIQYITVQYFNLVGGARVAVPGTSVLGGFRYCGNAKYDVRLGYFKDILE